MSSEKAKKQLQLVKLLFEPSVSSNELTFSKMCKFIRESFGVTQSEMAEKLQVGFSTYQQWEYGKFEPSSKAAANLCLMYLQCLYLEEQSPKATQINSWLDSLLNKKPSEPEKEQQLETTVAA